MISNGECQVATASPHINDLHVGLIFGHSQAFRHYELTVRTGDQHPRIHYQVQTEELFATDEISHRLSRGALAHGITKPFTRFAIHLNVEFQVKIKPPATQGIGQQQFGVEPTSVAMKFRCCWILPDQP